jgi:hypothetical protein
MRGHPSLVEKLADELGERLRMSPDQLRYGCAVGTGFVQLDYGPRQVDAWPADREYWCEHCPQYGHCSICGQDHAGSLGGA